MDDRIPTNPWPTDDPDDPSAPGASPLDPRHDPDAIPSPAHPTPLRPTKHWPDGFACGHPEGCLLYDCLDRWLGHLHQAAFRQRIRCKVDPDVADQACFKAWEEARELLCLVVTGEMMRSHLAGIFSKRVGYRIIDILRTHDHLRDARQVRDDDLSANVPPDARLIEEEERVALYPFWAALSSEPSRRLYQYYLEGHTYIQIAEPMHLAWYKIRDRIKTAIELLRRYRDGVSEDDSV
jgi:DNA-directed RNA polymerase specialized sigma24 family protein